MPELHANWPVSHGLPKALFAATWQALPGGRTALADHFCVYVRHHSWTYQCKNPEVYLQRPTRTQILK